MLDKNKINLWFYLLMITYLSIVVMASDVWGLNQNANTLQGASPNNPPEPNSVTASSQDMYKKAVSFVEKDRFDNAWPLLEQALDNSDASLVCRKALIILQQLSYGQYRLELLKNPSQDNLALVKNVRTKALKVRELLHYITIDDKRLAAFAGAKDRLLHRIFQLTNQCNTQEAIISEIDSAKIAFEQKDYTQELICLKKAAKLGGDIDEQLAQCKLFVSALEKFNQKQYEQAEKLFSEIEKDDRRYYTTRVWLKKIKTEIFARDSMYKLNSAWKRPDWPLLKNLIKEIEKNLLFERSSELANQRNITKQILQKRALYLSKKDFISAAKHLKKITEILEENPYDMYSNAQKWAANEWENLTPKINSQIKTLIQNSNVSWSNYRQNPITDIEIEGLTTATDYRPIASKVEYLHIAHQKLSEASLLANIINKQSNTSNLLSELESEILNHCKMLFNRAYILERNYGDTATAKKIYEVVVVMPVFPSNNYPEQAKRRLKNLRK